MSGPARPRPNGPARAGSENKSPAHPAQFFGKFFFFLSGIAQ